MVSILPLILNSFSLFPTHYQYYYHFHPGDFLIPALSDGLLLESEWQLVSSSVQDSSQYSIRSQQYSNQDCLFLYSNLNFLHNSYLIIFSIQSCLVLYSFCVNLLHSLIKWLIVSTPSPHNIQLRCCCVLSIFASTLLVLMVLFWIAIKRNAVSLLKIPFLSHV